MGDFCSNMVEHILDLDVLSISTNKIGVSEFCIFFFLRLSHLLKIFPYATILTCVSKFTYLLGFFFLEGKLRCMNHKSNYGFLS